MSDQFTESGGRHIPEEASAKYPTVFDLSVTKKPVTIPLSVIYPARKAHAEAKFPSYGPVDVRCDELLGENASDEDRRWAAETPYRVQAKDGRIYISDSSLKDPHGFHSALPVLRIDYDPDTGEAHKVWRDADPNTFKLTMSAFPDNSVVGKIRETLEIEKPSEQDVKRHGEIAAESKQIEETITELQSLTGRPIFDDRLVETAYNTSRIHQVGQGEYSIASFPEVEWLATYGASSCFIVLIHDIEDRQAALAHIDATVDVEGTLDRMFGSLRSTKKGRVELPSQYQVMISGGDFSSMADIAKAYNKIKQWKVDHNDSGYVKVGRIFQGSSESVAVNLFSGEIDSFVPSQTLGKNDAILDRSKIDARLIGDKKSVATLTLPRQKSR